MVSDTQGGLQKVLKSDVPVPDGIDVHYVLNAVLVQVTIDCKCDTYRMPIAKLTAAIKPMTVLPVSMNF